MHGWSTIISNRYITYTAVCVYCLCIVQNMSSSDHGIENGINCLGVGGEEHIVGI